MRKPERLATGRYKVRFRLGGKQTSETFSTKTEAVTFAKLLSALGPQGALDHLIQYEQAATIPTLNEVAADHIAHLTSIEDGTRLNYERLWARTWGPRIGRTQAHMVSKDLLSRTVLELADTYSAKSLKNQRGLLAAVCQRAVDLGYLPTNPTKGLRLPRGKEHERPDMRILTREEFDDVLDGIREHYRPLVMFLYGTGCRWGEAVALQVGDVAPPNVRIRRALKWSADGQRAIGPTKTRKSNRTIALPPQVVDVLDLSRPKTTLLFTAPRGGMVMHRTFWHDIWLPAVRDLEPRPRIHDLRHTHASQLLAAGVPIHVVQARLGHESIQTTVDTYSHLMPDAQMQAAQAASLAFRETPKQIEG